MQYNKKMLKENKNGFSLIEIIIVVAILSVLAATVVSGFIAFNKNSTLKNNSEEFVSVVKLAQNQAMSSENYSRYGIHIDKDSSPNKYVLFQGDTYNEEATTNQTYNLDNSMEFGDDGLNQVVFERLTGFPDQSGSVSLQIRNEPSKSKTIDITNSGETSSGPLVGGGNFDAERKKDYRHVRFSYTDYVDTGMNPDSIILVFDPNGPNETTKTIMIDFSNMIGEEFQYEGVTNVGLNDTEELRITTQGLSDENASMTIFNVYRDPRYNDKALDIYISGGCIIAGVPLPVLQYNDGGEVNIIRYSENGEPIISDCYYISDFVQI